MSSTTASALIPSGIRASTDSASIGRTYGVRSSAAYRSRPVRPACQRARRRSSSARSFSAAMTKATCSSNSTPSCSAPSRTSSRLTAAANDGCLSFFLTDFGRQALEALGPHVGAREQEAAQLVDGVERLLHRRLARDAHEVGVGGDRAHDLGVDAARFELLHARPGVAVLLVVHVREALVVHVVQQSDDEPALGDRRPRAGRRPPSPWPRPGSGGAAIPTAPSRSAGTGPRRAKAERTWLLP